MLNRYPAARRCIALLAVITLGCAAGGATHHHSSNSSSATAPSTQSTGPRSASLSSAVPIDHFRDESHDVDLRNQLSFPKTGDVYFGQCDTYDNDPDTATATTPLIVAASKGAWVALDLKDARLANAEWQFVASGPADGEIWGVLDDTLTHKGKVILLAHSTDAAQTWTITQVTKPFETGEYDSFAMDKSGHGRLTVYLTPTTRHPSRSGFYHFHTTDGGKTWSSPDHENDNLDPADDVPTDEDPPPLRSTPMQNARL
jgi:hypothetical protein